MKKSISHSNQTRCSSNKAAPAGWLSSVCSPNGVKIASFVVALVLLIWAARQVDLRVYFDGVERMGPAGIFFFIGVYLALSLLFFPISVLNLAGGALFGFWTASVAIAAAVTANLLISFLLARYGARDWLNKKIASNLRFKAVQEAVSHHPFKMIVLIRLCPVLPFNVVNFLLGLTTVKLKDYLIASYLGMLPGIFLHAYLGSLAGSLIQEDRMHWPGSAAEWGMTAAAALCVAVLMYYLTYLARKAFQRALENPA